MLSFFPLFFSYLPLIAGLIPPYHSSTAVFFCFKAAKKPHPLSDTKIRKQMRLIKFMFQTAPRRSSHDLVFLLKLSADRTKQCERDQSQEEPADRGVEEYDRVTAGL